MPLSAIDMWTSINQYACQLHSCSPGCTYSTCNTIRVEKTTSISPRMYRKICIIHNENAVTCYCIYGILFTNHALLTEFVQCWVDPGCGEVLVKDSPHLRLYQPSLAFTKTELIYRHTVYIHADCSKQIG